ncbi:citrate/2-methylcitrate synthase [Desulfotignum balticum]|uniref:citrate/2-methylcitrate synthase n=1 Tax=Desulfotignum balticum TaxID=115781 RepID=UPI00248065C8|nr:citrate/2-methylcitrate synthase [Desulfotignum balticum]
MEQAVLGDACFISRHLYPNIDFYSGITLRVIRIPKQSRKFSQARFCNRVASCGHPVFLIDFPSFLHPTTLLLYVIIGYLL